MTANPELTIKSNRLYYIYLRILSIFGIGVLISIILYAIK
jgi:hypothetical protein